MKYIFLAFLFFSACSSEPTRTPEAAWIQQPTRTVDNGYIVYIGKGTANSPERAQFRAEGIALEDLANECSFIPKGSRIEDRYLQKDNNIYTAYVKLGLEFQSCNFSKNAIQPEEIKNLASVPFTLQLKKYQDLVETGEMPDATEIASVTPPEEYAAAPVRTVNTSDDVHFFVTRQYVAYQKEIVVLSPPAAYAPQSPESQKFVSAVTPSVQQIHTTEQSNPQILKQPITWSQIHDRPKLERPQSLRARANSAHSRPMRVMQNPGAYGRPAGAQKGRGRRRKRSRRNEDNHF